MKNRFLFKVTILIIFLFTHSLSALDEVSPKKISLIFTTKNDGILRDCECEVDCPGGLPERLSLFEKHRLENPGAIFLDAGDFSTTMGRQRKDEIVLEAYKILNYDAIGIGDQEFINGEKFFRYKEMQSNLPFVCANIEFPWHAGKKPKSHIIKETSACKIGIAGIISESVFHFVAPEKHANINIEPYLPALKEAVVQMRAESDIVIILAQLLAEEIEIVANEIDKIDIIISGHSVEAPDNPFRIINGKIVMDAGVEGSYVGILDISLNFQNEIVNTNFDLLCVNSNFEKDARLQYLINPFFEEFEILRKRTGPITTGFPFFGTTYCRQCHVVEYDRWLNSKHATASGIFRQNSTETDETCLECHSMAGRLKGTANFRRAIENEYNRNVQCEACHRIDVNRLDPVFDKHAANDAKQTCVRCHDQKNSPNFDFITYWEKIAH